MVIPRAAKVEMMMIRMSATEDATNCPSCPGKPALTLTGVAGFRSGIPLELQRYAARFF
jgi:hypothetical protein